MFDFQISKHPHYDDACRAFAQRHNMAKLAERAGMNVQTLRNKLNPEQPHQFTPPELWLLTDLTEDSTLVDGFLTQTRTVERSAMSGMVSVSGSLERALILIFETLYSMLLIRCRRPQRTG
ncbi:phage regulatory CII family protein [Enterobacter sp. SST3]|nr:phage regulatory CII family protein [Enterobacter sp. SST3]